jgi:hypothetical protein
VGETAKKTLLAALVAWVLARKLRRLVGVALLAAILTAGITIAGRHGIDIGGVRRVVQCETRAIARVAKQLHDSGSSSSPSAARRQRRALRRLGDCAAHGPSRAPRHDRPRR